MKHILVPVVCKDELARQHPSVCLCDAAKTMTIRSLDLKNERRKPANSTSREDSSNFFRSFRTSWWRRSRRRSRSNSKITTGREDERNHDAVWIRKAGLLWKRRSASSCLRIKLSQAVALFFLQSCRVARVASARGPVVRPPRNGAPPPSIVSRDSSGTGAASSFLFPDVPAEVDDETRQACATSTLELHRQESGETCSSIDIFGVLSTRGARIVVDSGDYVAPVQGRLTSGDFEDPPDRESKRDLLQHDANDHPQSPSIFSQLPLSHGGEEDAGPHQDLDDTNATRAYSNSIDANISYFGPRILGTSTDLAFATASANPSTFDEGGAEVEVRCRGERGLAMLPNRFEDRPHQPYMFTSSLPTAAIMEGASGSPTHRIEDTTGPVPWPAAAQELHAARHAIQEHGITTRRSFSSGRKTDQAPAPSQTEMKAVGPTFRLNVPVALQRDARSANAAHSSFQRQPATAKGNGGVSGGLDEDTSLYSSEDPSFLDSMVPERGGTAGVTTLNGPAASGGSKEARRNDLATRWNRSRPQEDAAKKSKFCAVPPPPRPMDVEPPTGDDCELNRDDDELRRREFTIRGRRAGSNLRRRRLKTVYTQGASAPVMCIFCQSEVETGGIIDVDVVAKKHTEQNASRRGNRDAVSSDALRLPSQQQKTASRGRGSVLERKLDEREATSASRSAEDSASKDESSACAALHESASGDISCKPNALVMRESKTSSLMAAADDMTPKEGLTFFSLSGKAASVTPGETGHSLAMREQLQEESRSSPTKTDGASSSTAGGGGSTFHIVRRHGQHAQGAEFAQARTSAGGSCEERIDKMNVRAASKTASTSSLLPFGAATRARTGSGFLSKYSISRADAASSDALPKQMPLTCSMKLLPDLRGSYDLVEQSTPESRSSSSLRESLLAPRKLLQASQQPPIWEETAGVDATKKSSEQHVEDIALSEKQADEKEAEEQEDDDQDCVSLENLYHGATSDEKRLLNAMLRTVAREDLTPHWSEVLPQASSCYPASDDNDRRTMYRFDCAHAFHSICLVRHYLKCLYQAQKKLDDKHLTAIISQNKEMLHERDANYGWDDLKTHQGDQQEHSPGEIAGGCSSNGIDEQHFYDQHEIVEASHDLTQPCSQAQVEASAHEACATNIDMGQMDREVGKSHIRRRWTAAVCAASVQDGFQGPTGGTTSMRDGLEKQEGCTTIMKEHAAPAGVVDEHQQYYTGGSRTKKKSAGESCDDSSEGATESSELFCTVPFACGSYSSCFPKIRQLKPETNSDVGGASSAQRPVSDVMDDQRTARGLASVQSSAARDASETSSFSAGAVSKQDKGGATGVIPKDQSISSSGSFYKTLTRTRTPSFDIKAKDAAAVTATSSGAFEVGVAGSEPQVNNLNLYCKPFVPPGKRTRPPHHAPGCQCRQCCVARAQRLRGYGDFWDDLCRNDAEKLAEEFFRRGRWLDSCRCMCGETLQKDVLSAVLDARQASTRIRRRVDRATKCCALVCCCLSFTCNHLAYGVDSMYSEQGNSFDGGQARAGGRDRLLNSRSRYSFENVAQAPAMHHMK